MYFVNSPRPCLLSLRFFAFFVSTLISLSLSVVSSLSCVTAVQLCFVLPLYFVNSLRLCLNSLSFFAFLCQFLNFIVFDSRSFSFLRHCLLLFLISRCISSILYVFVCFLCHSLRFVVSSLIDLSLSDFLSLSCVTSV